MTLLPILFGAGLVAGIAVFGIVYFDSGKRGFPVASRILLATAAGGGGFAGFLVPHVFDQKLQYVYFQFLKPRPMTVVPREWMAVTLTTGVVISVVLVGLYLVGSRFLTRATETR